MLFDVVSLFTKVPIELAIYVARERLQEDNTLDDRTALSINDIIQLLEFCLKATYFSFRGQYYQQIFGTAMGSLMSVIVAYMVMENIEQRALTSFLHPPIFWKRYVDDTCVALLPSMVESFHQHLNSIELSVGRSLFSRALTHSSSLIQQVEEESLIFQALQKNGYPINFIKK